MHRIICLLAISAAAACSSSTGPSGQQYDDTAQQLGSTTSTGSGGGDVGSMSDVVVLANGTALTGFTAGASGSFSGSHLGLMYDYTLTCKDAGGNLLAACAATTDSADATIAWSGTLTLPNLMATVDRSGSWMVTGLQSGTVKFDGSGMITLDATVISIFRPVTSTYTLTADATYDSVLFDTATKAAIGGDIKYDVAATATTANSSTGNDSSDKFDIDAEIVFAASGTATLTLDGSNVYTVNTSTGVVVKVN